MTVQQAIQAGHQTIQRGSKGVDVKAAQERLIARFYDVGPSGADGIFGPHTYRAVIDYQDDRSSGSTVGLAFNLPLKPDGIVGIHTWTRLDPGIIKNGSTGALVILLQNLLNFYGYVVGTPDGAFGPVTEAKVKEFQTDYGLPITGVVDTSTWDNLGS